MHDVGIEVKFENASARGTDGHDESSGVLNIISPSSCTTVKVFFLWADRAPKLTILSCRWTQWNRCHSKNLPANLVGSLSSPPSRESGRQLKSMQMINCLW